MNESGKEGRFNESEEKNKGGSGKDQKLHRKGGPFLQASAPQDSTLGTGNPHREASWMWEWTLPLWKAKGGSALQIGGPTLSRLPPLQRSLGETGDTPKPAVLPGLLEPRPGTCLEDFSGVGPSPRRLPVPAARLGCAWALVVPTRVVGNEGVLVGGTREARKNGAGGPCGRMRTERGGRASVWGEGQRLPDCRDAAGPRIHAHARSYQQRIRAPEPAPGPGARAPGRVGHAKVSAPWGAIRAPQRDGHRGDC